MDNNAVGFRELTVEEANSSRPFIPHPMVQASPEPLRQTTYPVVPQSPYPPYMPEYSNRYPTPTSNNTYPLYNYEAYTNRINVPMYSSPIASTNLSRGLCAPAIPPVGSTMDMRREPAGMYYNFNTNAPRPPIYYPSQAIIYPHSAIIPPPDARGMLPGAKPVSVFVLVLAGY
jgi:hypothetical protein